MVVPWGVGGCLFLCILKLEDEGNFLVMRSITVLFY